MARSRSEAHTAPDRPYAVPFAMASAPSSPPSYGTTVSTGPKTSSCSIVEPASATSTVGFTKKPVGGRLGLLRPAGDELGAVVDRGRDVRPDALLLDLADQRALLGVGRQRVADRRELREDLEQPLDLGQPVARDEQPGRGAAGLPGVDEAAGERAGDGVAELVGGQVVEQHRRALAAELQRRALRRRGGELGDAAAGAGRAGEGHHVDQRVAHDRLADDRSGAGHEVEDAGRQADRLHDLGEQVGDAGHELRRLEHDGAAGGEGRLPPWRRSGAAGSSTA